MIDVNFPIKSMIDVRIKWMKASLEVSKSKDSGYYRTIRGLWIAFFLAPQLEEESSIEKFKKTYKE
jgi:hypothetical protein